jgi:hypothetical protein
LYVIWNNGGPQDAMGYWLKSFNKKPAPLPGVTFSISDINQRPFHPSSDSHGAYKQQYLSPQPVFSS